MKDSTTNTTIMLYFEGNLITPQKVTFFLEARYNFCLSHYFGVKLHVYDWFCEIYSTSLLQFTVRPINPIF